MLALIDRRICDLCSEQGRDLKDGEVVRLGLDNRINEADLCESCLTDLRERLSPFLSLLGETALETTATSGLAKRQCPTCNEWFSPQGFGTHTKACAAMATGELEQRVPCPHCDRSFIRLGKHLSSAHPGEALKQLEISA